MDDFIDFTPNICYNVNFACSEMIKQPLKDLLDSYIKPERLCHEIKLSQLLSLTSEEKLKCCPTSSVPPKYDAFDVKLLYKLIRSICPLPTPTKGWGEKPEANETNLGDDVERLIQFRDEIVVFADATKFDEKKYDDVWNDLEFAIERIKIFTKKHGHAASEYQANLARFKGEIIKTEDGLFFRQECTEGEGLVNITMLKKNPNILNFIAGKKDGQDVVKVFISGDDKEEVKARDDFQKACYTSRKMLFEFVNVDKQSKAITIEAQKIHFQEKKSKVIDESTRSKIQEVIDDAKRAIFANHSTVIGIRISNVRNKGESIIEEPCIVLYCLDKHIVPFGEKPLPATIAKWHCDHREDYAMFAVCPTACPAPNITFPEPGCGIGIASSRNFGSTGFLVESKDNSFEHGFLTAAHIAVKGYRILYKDGKFVPGFVPLALQMANIVHGSSANDQHINRRVGGVVEAFFGNYKNRALDFAFVHSDTLKDNEREEMTIIGENDVLINDKVTKTGRKTGVTTSYITATKFDCRIPHINKTYLFLDCYGIDNTGLSPFAKEGDSGSAVLVEKKGTFRPLGILFGRYNSNIAVCKIDEIINQRHLRIVQIKQ